MQIIYWNKGFAIIAVGGLGEKVNVLSQLEIRGESYHLFDINYSVLWVTYDFEISISNDRDLGYFIYAIVGVEIKDGQVLTRINSIIGSLRGVYYLLNKNSKRVEFYLKIDDKDLHNVEVRFFGPEKRPDAGSSTMKVNQAITVFPNGAIEIK